MKIQSQDRFPKAHDYNKVSQEVKSLCIDGAMFMFIENASR